MAVGVAPFERLRGMVGEYDVLDAILGFDGSDGTWPNEDALVASVEAVRDWPTDALAESAWRRSIRDSQAGLGVAPRCSTLSGPGFAIRVIGDSLVSARHSVAVRRQALTVQYPQSGALNPQDLPTWTSLPCAGAVPGDVAPAVRAP